MCSQACKNILEADIGYRDENYSGSGVTSLREVITFEMTELCNTDIPETLKEIYDDFPNIEISQEDSCKLANFVIDYVEDKLGKSDCKALWLADREGFIENYIDSYNLDTYGEDYVDECKVVLPADYCVISDLGSQGILIAY